ncbi:MAG: ABC transporter permease [Candidatus Angelobacter sp.]
MSALLQDLRYSLRFHAKSGNITLLAVLTVALGIAASTAVFSVVNTILLTPLPYPHSERIVIPWRLPPPALTIGYNEIPWGRPEVLLFEKENKSFESIGAFKGDSLNLTGVSVPVRLDGLRVSSGFFQALGVQPILGRTFNVEEDQAGHDHEAILSHQVWQDQFGNDTNIVGKAIDLNGSPYTVIGVMPPGFSFPHAQEMPGIFNFPRAVQIWIPLALPTGPVIPGELSEFAIISRTKPGTTLKHVQTEMDILEKRLESEHPRAKGWYHSRVASLEQQVTGETRLPLLLILGTVGIVLLIACANVANLLLAQSVGRRRELTVRTALGAKQSRLIRQLLTESLVLASCAGIVGVLLAGAAVYAVKLFGPADIPRLKEVSLDLRVFAFSMALTFLTGILFGLVPAFGATRLNLVDSLKEGQRAGLGLSGARFRKAVLVSQMAFALVLVVAASLLTQTFFHLVKVDLGFNPESVVTFELSLPPVKYKEHSQIVTLYQKVLQQLRSVPTILSAGLVETVPMGGATESTMLRIPGRANANPKESPFANYTIASPGYFAAAGTPILRGRDFLESDVESSTPVAIINTAMAKKFWPDEDPLGKQVGTPTVRDPATIIGIVPDLKHLSLREAPDPEMYVPYTQKVYPSMLTMDVVLRTKVDPGSVIDDVRQAVRSVDPDLPIAKVLTLTTLVNSSMAQQKFSVYLIATFGALALALASIGMYGVISYSVAQRTREIGIRMALGAQPQNILAMVLQQGARLAGLGIAIGLVAAFGAGRLIANFLYGVRASDPMTFAGVALLLLAVAFFACYLPARRASRVDPIDALRYE